MKVKKIEQVKSGNEDVMSTQRCAKQEIKDEVKDFVDN